MPGEGCPPFDVVVHVISVIVPARNESAVIARTLKTMIDGALQGELEVIVVCNGCSDDTAEIARRIGLPVRVIETESAGKSHALNLGDQAARSFPRIYVDADVIIPIGGVRILARHLSRDGILAAAPTPDIDLTGCSWWVRAFYDIRALLPSSREGIGGSGVYALSRAGRRRFERFPRITADDGYVRLHFKSHERATLATARSKVFAPRTIKDLIATKTRAHYGSFELASRCPRLSENRGNSNHNAILALFRRPMLWPKLLVYNYVTILARHRARVRLRAGDPGWERDDTSRAAI